MGATSPDSTALVGGWLEHSPFARHLGIDGEPVAKGLVTYRVFTDGSAR